MPPKSKKTDAQKLEAELARIDKQMQKALTKAEKEIRKDFAKLIKEAEKKAKASSKKPISPRFYKNYSQNGGDDEEETEIAAAKYAADPAKLYLPE